MAVEEKIRKLAPLGKAGADLAWLFYLSGEQDERRAAEDLLDIQLFQQARKGYEEEIFLDPPSPGVCDGPYRLGQVIYPPGRIHGSFGVREEEWTHHVLIVGITGGGKTNLSFHILRELAKKGKPFLVFDWKKTYRHLRHLPEFQSLGVFTAARPERPFYFNPLAPPPGTATGEWLMKLVDVIKHAYFEGAGAGMLLREAIDKAYEQAGHYEDPSKLPTLFMAREYLRQRRLGGRMGLWKASAMRALESMCYKHGLGPMLNVPEPMNPDFLDSQVVLELDALSDDDKTFLAEALILWIYEYRKNKGRSGFEHALVIEEAHHILNKEKERAAGGETIMETCLRQVREYGEAIIVIDQEPSKLSDSIKANTNTKITFNLGNGKDIEDISRCMGLNEEEREYIKLLNVGSGIVSLRSRTAKPLHVKFPWVL